MQFDPRLLESSIERCDYIEISPGHLWPAQDASLAIEFIAALLAGIYDMQEAHRPRRLDSILFSPCARYPQIARLSKTYVFRIGTRKGRARFSGAGIVEVAYAPGWLEWTVAAQPFYGNLIFRDFLLGSSYGDLQGAWSRFQSMIDTSYSSGTSFGWLGSLPVIRENSLQCDPLAYERAPKLTRQKTRFTIGEDQQSWGSFVPFEALHWSPWLSIGEYSPASSRHVLHVDFDPAIHSSLNLLWASKADVAAVADVERRVGAIESKDAVQSAKAGERPPWSTPKC